MIVYYISSHGFGHAVRSCEVMRHLSPEIPILIRSMVPEWFLRGELSGREAAFAPARLDSGTVGPDSTAVDLRMTLDAAEPLLADMPRRIDEEARFLRSAGATLVVSDIPPLPLAAARQAGIRSILIGNFTWSAIFRPLAAGCGPELSERLAAAIATMDEAYAQGDLLLIPGFAVPMEACREQKKIPLIARLGIDKRAELAASLGLDAARPIVLLYVGTEGRQGVRWERLAELGDYQFIAYHPPRGAEQWVSAVPQSFKHVDVVATADAVVAKPGYSMMAECLRSGTPVLTSPRPQFIESDVILGDLEAWGGAVCIPEEDFIRLDWRLWLDQISGLKRKARPIDASGGSAAAREIMAIYNQRIAPGT